MDIVGRLQVTDVGSCCEIPATPVVLQDVFALCKKLAGVSRL